MAKLIPVEVVDKKSSNLKLIPVEVVGNNTNLGKESTAGGDTSARQQFISSLLPDRNNTKSIIPMAEAAQKGRQEFVSTLLPDRNNIKSVIPMAEAAKKARVRDLITTGGVNNRVEDAQKAYDEAKELLKHPDYQGKYLPKVSDFLYATDLFADFLKKKKELYNAKKEAALLNGEAYDPREGNDAFATIADTAMLGGEYVGNSIAAGMGMTVKGATATANLAYNIAAGYLLEHFGVKGSIFSSLNDKATDALNDYNNKMNKSAALVGDKYAIGGNIISNVVAMIPSMMVAWAKAGKAVIKVGSYLVNGGGSAILNTVKSYASNPVYWDSFLRTLGTDYEDAKENGASEAQALSFAFLTSSVNAAVEIGGVQELPGELQGTVGSKRRMWEFFKTALDEGKEEGVQRIISDVNSHLVYGNNFMKDKTVKQYGKEVFGDAAMGFAVGAVMSGAQLTIDYSLNAKTESEYKAIGKELTRAGEDKAKAIINYGAKSLDTNVREAAIGLRSGKKDYIALGQLYQYTINDITTYLTTPSDISVVNENFENIIKNNASNLIQDIAVSQYVSKLIDLGNDINTANNTVNEVMGMYDENYTKQSGEDNITGEKSAETPEIYVNTEADIEAPDAATPDNPVLQSNANENIEDGDRAAAQKSIEDLVKTFNNRTGRNTGVVFDENVAAGEYDPNTDTIRLNPNMSTKEMTVEVFKHELMHSLESKKLYGEFKAFLFDESTAFRKWVENNAMLLADEKGVDYDDLNYDDKAELMRDFYIEKNRENNTPFAAEEAVEKAEREMVADFFGEVLFTGDNQRIANMLRSGNALDLTTDSQLHIESLQEEFINEVAKEKRSLLQRIVDFIRDVIRSFKGTKQTDPLLKELQKLEGMLQNVIDSEDIKNTAESKDISYSSGSPSQAYNDSSKDVDNYTEEQYNNFGWASYNKVITPAERETLFSRYADYKHNKDKYPTTRFGEAVIHSYDYPDVIAYIKGSFANPEITKIVRINAKYETLSEIKEEILHNDREKVFLPYENVIDLFGEEILTIDKRKDYASFQEYKTRRKRGSSGESDTDSGAGENGARSIQTNKDVDRADLKESAFSMPENDDVSHSFGSPAQSLRYDSERYANWLKRKYRSEADTGELSEKLKTAVKLYNKFQTAEADSIIKEISVDIAETVKPELTTSAQGVIDYLKGGEVSLNASQAAELKNRGISNGEFKKVTGLKITEDGTPLDTRYTELANEYPGRFDGDISDADQAVKLYEKLSDIKQEYLEEDTEGIAESVAKDIKHTLDTTGGRYEQERLRTAVKEAKEQGEASGKAALERYKQVLERRKSRTDITAEKNKIKREFERKRKRLENRLTKPKQNGHIPKPFTSAIADVLDSFKEINYQFNDELVAAKYAADLEKLEQELQIETDEAKKDEIQDRFNRKWAKAREMADNINRLSSAFERLKDNQSSSAIWDSDVQALIDYAKEAVGNTPAHLLSLSQMTAVNNAMSAIEKQIENYDKAISLDYEKEISEIGSQWLKDIRLANQGGFINGILNSRYVTSMLDPTRFIRRISNYSETGDLIVKMLNDAQHQEQSYQYDAESLFNHLLNGDNFEKAAELQSTKAKDLVDSFIYTDSGDMIKVTKATRLHLIMDSFNYDNMRHFANHALVPSVNSKGEVKRVQGNLTSDFEKFNIDNWRKRLTENLSVYELEWLSALQSYYWDFSGKKLNEVTLKRFGFEKAINDYYYGIVSDPDFIDSKFESVKHDFTYENSGVLKERIRSKNPIIVEDAITKLQRDIQHNAKIYAYMIPMHDFNRIYNYKTDNFETSIKSEIRDMISAKTKLKSGAVDSYGIAYIERLVDNLYGIGKSKPSIFDKLRGKRAQSVLPANLPVTIKQAASYPTAAAELGWEPLAKALVFVEKEGGKKGFVFSKAETEVIEKYSKLLWYRMQGNVDSELGDINADRSFSDRLAKSAPGVFGWIQKVDGATVGRLWYASKYYVDDNFSNLKKGSDAYYKKVAEVFERTVERTQPNYTIMQRPHILREENSLTKALTMFYTQRLQNVNILVDAVGEYRARALNYKTSKDAASLAELKAAKKRLGNALSSQIVSAATLSLMELLARVITNNMKPYRDDESGEITFASLMMGLGDTFLNTVIGSFLFGSEFYEAARAILSKGKYYGFQVPAVESANDLIKGIVNISKDASLIGELAQGEMSAKELADAYKDNLIDLIEAIGEFSGVPIKNIKKLALGAYYDVADIITGEAFATAVANNKVNDFFNVKGLTTKSQNYKKLLDYAEKGDTKKYDALYKELTESGITDSDIQKGLKAQIEKDKEFNKKFKAEESELQSNKAYGQLTAEAQEKAESSLKSEMAIEKKADFNGEKAVYDEMYKLVRDGGTKTEDYQNLRNKLAKKGKSEKQINDGIEAAKIRYMRSVGIDVKEYAIYLAMKDSSNRSKVDLDGDGKLSENERIEGLYKMKISKAAKEYFQNYK